MKTKLIRYDYGESRLFMFCPGCKFLHSPTVDDDYRGWKWNGSSDKPTLHPSILVQWNSAREEHRCHSFVRDGQWEFLADSTHDLAGQTADMVDIPESMMPYEG